MKIDKNLWNADRLEVEQKIRTLKDSIRNGGERMAMRWSDGKYQEVLVKFEAGNGQDRDYTQLKSLKDQATTLYQIRALSRGRRHQLKEVSYTGAGERIEAEMTLEQEQANVSMFIDRYLVKAAAA